MKVAPVAWYWLEDPWGISEYHVVWEDPEDSKWTPLYDNIELEAELSMSMFATREDMEWQLFNDWRDGLDRDVDNYHAWAAWKAAKGIK